MKIRKSKMSDIETMLQLFENGRKIMRENGNMTQWQGGYPQREVLESDIAQGESYVCVDGDEIVGTCCFMQREEPTYLKIYDGEWLNKEPYCTVHRITSCRRGTGSFMIEHFFELSKNLRVDTHRDNRPMRSLLEKEGFTYCGIIYLADGSERLAYQKIKK